VLGSNDQGVVYLTLGDVLAFHADIFDYSDAEAQLRLRAPEILKSALARPEQYAYYQEADLALQAAILAHGIAEGQPFINGNKRTAAIALVVFLDINGIELTVADEDLAAYIWWLSEDLPPEELADLLRPHLKPRG
jgi:death-on-curing protein